MCQRSPRQVSQHGSACVTFIRITAANEIEGIIRVFVSSISAELCHRPRSRPIMT